MNNQATKFFAIALMLMTITSVSFGQKRQEKTSAEIFKPIPVDRADGFYETISDGHSTDNKDITWSEHPSLTSKDISTVEKTRDYKNRPEISLAFTKEGARKFYLLTKKNIGKYMAIVIDKRIVMMPRLNSGIKGGKATISGNFSDGEIDKMIKKLKAK